MTITEVVVESSWTPDNVEGQRGRRVIARTTDGKLHIVYIDRGTSADDVYYRNSDDDGVSWGGRALLSQGGVSPCKMLSMMADDNDELHVGWEYDDGPGIICYRHWNGSSWDSIVDVDDGETALDFADISIDHADVQHLIYQRTTGSNRYLSEKRRVLGSWGARVDIQGASSPIKNQPHGICRIGSSQHWVFWQHPPGSWRNIYSNIWSSGSWGSPAIVEEGGSNHLQNARASIDSDGYIHLVYSSIESPTVTKYKKYTGSWSSEVTVFSNGSYNRQRSAIAVNDLDEVDIFCEGVQATGRNIVHKHSDDGTPSFGSEVALTSGTDIRQWPSAWCRNRYGSQDRAAAGYALAFQARTATDFIFGYSDDFETPGAGAFIERFAAAGIGIATAVKKNITKVAGAGVGIIAAAETFKFIFINVAASIGVAASVTKGIIKRVGAAIGISAKISPVTEVIGDPSLRPTAKVPSIGKAYQLRNFTIKLSADSGSTISGELAEEVEEWET